MSSKQSILQSSNNYISIKESLFLRLISFFKIVIESGDDLLNSNLRNSNDFTSTIKELSFAIYSSQSPGQDKYELTEKLVTQQKEIDALKRNLIELNQFYQESIKENKDLLLKLNKEQSDKEICEISLNSLKKDCDSKDSIIDDLNKEIDKLNNNIQKNERLFKNQVVAQDDNSETLTKTETSANIDAMINNKKLLAGIFNYLDYKDIICLKNSSRKIFSLLESNFSKSLLLSIKNFIIAINTNNKQNLLKSLSKEFFLNQDALSSNVKKDSTEIERLFKTYFREKKVPAKNLKDQMLICLNFLERDVKIPLDLESSLKGKPHFVINYNDQQNKSITGLFKKILNNENNKNKQIVNEPSIENQYLINHLTQLNINFEYKSKNEINYLLNLMYNSNFTSDFINQYNKELTNNFSGLLYYANEAINDIKEIDYLKELINHRFESYYKSYNELETEVESLRKYNKTNKEIKEFLSSNKNSLEIKYSSCKTEMVLQQQELNKRAVNYQSLENEYIKKRKENEFLKTKLISEYNKFKQEMEYSKQEKLEILNNIFELKHFFLKFNLTEDGDVVVYGDI